MVVLLILLFLIILVLTLKIKIEVNNINFSLKEPTNNGKVFNIEENFLFKISLKIFGFIPIFKINITSKKVNEISKKTNIKSHLKSFNKYTFLKDIREIIESMNLKINRINLKAQIGLDNIILLTNIIPFFSTIISILLVKKRVKIKNQYYKIVPIYNRRKFIEC